MTLPPLNALRAFEAVARTGSFTAAARELRVSPAAVSQHARNLERFFGKQLLSRHGNRLGLTDAGHAIHAAATQALGDLAQAAARVLEGEARPRLVVSVPLSLAEPWLLPRLARLADAHPRVAVDLRVEDDPSDGLRHGVDLRVSYGAYHYPDLKAVPLFHDEVVPVCAPDFVARDTPLASLPESLFVHTNWGAAYASHPTWSDWFAREAHPCRPDPARGRRVGVSGLAAAAARAGIGVALAQRGLIEADLANGRLVPLSASGLKLGHPYCAVFGSPRPRREAEALLALLQA